MTEELKVEIVEVKDLKSYKNNAKEHPIEQVEQIAQSIKEFGFNDPLGIDEDNIVLEGNGRLEAIKKLGIEKVPCIRLKGLTDQQKKSYVLIHNKLTMNSDFNIDVLLRELDSITDYDMTDYGFEIPEFEDDLTENEDGYYGDERERTYNGYNLEYFDENRTDGLYQMPIIKAQHCIPNDLISFNYVLGGGNTDCGVHFYIDDYQFERIWNNPKMYIDKLKNYECVFTPDFSLYLDMPLAMKVWNVYRSKLIGQIMQDAGITVIPTLQWAGTDTLPFAFDGIEQGGTVTVSTIGVKSNDISKNVWYNGMTEALKVIKPKEVLVYGGDIGYSFPDDVFVRYYDNKAFNRK